MYLLGFIFIILFFAILLVLGVNARIQQLQKEKYSDETRFVFISKVCSLAISIIFNMRVEAEGLEQLEKIEKGVLFPNHQSNLDIVALLKIIKRPHGYVSKKELENIFLFSDAMRLIRCLFIDRENVRQSVKVISEAIKIVKEGYLMVIFPEGTRKIRGEMGTFKAGSFKIAQKAQADIIPVTIYNSYEILKRWPRKTIVKIKFHPLIPYEKYQSMSTNELSEKVETIVKNQLDSPRND